MSEPWLEHYDPGVPPSIGTYPAATLVDVVAERARRNPSETALIFKGRHVSYGQLDDAGRALASSFRQSGIKPGDRIALLLPNSPQFLISELGAWRAGAIVAPQNPIYTPRELEQSLDASKPRIVVALTLFYDKVKGIQPATTIERVIATNVKEYLPPILSLLFTILKEKKEGYRIALHKGDLWFREAVRDGSLNPMNESLAAPEEPAVILMSGGTTGTPKGVVSDHRALIMAGTQLAAWLDEAISVPNGKILLPLPLFHTYGCAGAQPISLLTGTPLVLVPNPRDFDDLLNTIAHERPTLICGVPTLLNAILNHRKVAAGKIDFSSLKACFSGAAALMAETKSRFEQVTGARIVEGYSLTEATMACCVNPLRGAGKIGSVGMPVSDVKVRIVDREDGTRVLPVGEIGEITMSAPQLMRGYWNNAHETASALRLGADGSTWLFTGDLGYLDEDGYVFIVDRKKDLIKTSGFQVWPREVEEVISTHPAVLEVGVAGLPDARKGEIVAAWVVPRAGATIDVGELRSFCKERLAPFKVPTRVEIRTELPKTMIGKVLRRALVAETKAAIPETKRVEVPR
jgi:long-chain acyl-CoA synthetase